MLYAQVGEITLDNFFSKKTKEGMNDAITKNIPAIYSALQEKGKEIGFTMPSDLYIGALLKTLIQSKPGGRILEFGTGIGLSLSWMLEGLDENAKLISIDNDPELIAMVKPFFDHDSRVELVLADGAEWLKTYTGPPFDLIFADAWPGKFYNLEETFDLLKVGGFYVIDDMRPADDWPEGHFEKVEALWAYYENRDDLVLTKMDWSTGVMVAVKR